MKNRCPLLESNQRESKAMPVIQCQSCTSIEFCGLSVTLSSDPMQRLGCHLSVISDYCKVVT